MKKNLLLIGAIALILIITTGCPEDNGSKTPKTDDSIKNVWMVGSHTGWFDEGHKKPIALTETTKGSGIFTWKGDFEGGEYFRFNCDVTMPTGTTGNNWILPAANYLIVCKELGTPEETSFTRGVSAEKSWVVGYEGTFTVTVNTKTSKVILTRDAGPAISNTKDVWVVGDATEWSWKTTTNKMTTADDITYTFTGVLKTGTEGISFIHNFDNPPNLNLTNCWFKSKAAGTSVANIIGAQEFDVVKGIGHGPMFAINFPGEYTITLNVQTLKVTFVKAEVLPPEPTNDYDVWIIGESAFWNASSNPDPGNVFKMTKTANVYTWTGTLIDSTTHITNEGILFVTDKLGKPEWGDAAMWLVYDGDANLNVTNDNGATARKIKEGVQSDSCFYIEKSGKYTITIDISAMTVKFQRTEFSADFDVWVVGGSTKWGWDNDNKMSKEGASYTWTGNLYDSSNEGKQGVSFVTNRSGSAGWGNESDALWFTSTGSGDKEYPNVTVESGEYPIRDGRQSPFFHIPKAIEGKYTITLNPTTMKVTFTKIGNIQIDVNDKFDIWIIGQSANWDFNIKMDKDLDNKIFTWTGSLSETTAGDKGYEGISFATSKTGDPAGWGAGVTWFVSNESSEAAREVKGSATPGEFELAEATGTQNPMFIIKTPGTYSITLNAETMSVTFAYSEAYDIWLMGDSNNWTDAWASSYYKMTENAGIYTWTGNLLAGGDQNKGIGFVTSKTGAPGWGGTWYISAVTELEDRTVENINSAQTFNVQSFVGDAGGARHWDLEAAGNYSVSINTTVTPMTVTFTRLGDTAAIENFSIWLFGQSVDHMESHKPAPDTLIMTKGANGIYTWTGNLIPSSKGGDWWAGLSFFTDKNGTFGDHWFVSAANGIYIENIFDTETAIIDNNTQYEMFGAGDPVDGNFTITLDTVGLTVKFVKND